MKYIRRERNGNPCRLILNIIIILLITASAVSSALAETGDPIETIANPAGTTITFFDYWFYDNKGKSATGYYNTGINKDHDFQFRSGGGTGINAFTGQGGDAKRGIVKPVLGTDGFPVLASGSQESLAYLFNNDPIDYDYNGTDLPAKRVYPVNFMFMVEEDGHYTFNSEFNKAVIRRDPDTFEALDPAPFSPDNPADITERPSTDGQFFPFNNGERPTDSNPDGWYFGAHVKSDFSIPYDGMVLNPSGRYQPMVFDFEGDDDVWFYIDGILIGDVGGIHNTMELHVNFTTGDVSTKNHLYNTHEFETTIYQMVVNAIGEEEAQSRFHWKEEEDGTYKTFAGNTYHTLDFFYLERGANRSNMEMRFNLVSTYHFSAHKSLHKSNSEDEEALRRNQFRYKLTGYPITDEEGRVVMEAVMPKKRPSPQVIWEPNYDPTKILLEENVSQVPFLKELIVGNSADGNVNFGNTDLDDGIEFDRYVGKTFRYKCEELPPADAVWNEATRTYTYHGETIYPNVNGNYEFDGIVYDGTVYYFEATVNPEGWVDKQYFTDATFTTHTNVAFSNFDNLYHSVGRANLKAYKRYYTYYNEHVNPDLNQFTFKLTDITDPANPVVIEASHGNEGNGRVAFNQILYTLDHDIPAHETTAVKIYKIEENNGGHNLIMYSNEVYYAKVTLTDDEDGSISVDIKYYSDEACTNEVPAAEVTFTNKVKALTIDKTIAGNIGDKNRIFNYTLTMPEMAGQTVLYSTDDGETHSSVTFDDSGVTRFTLGHLDEITFYEVWGNFTVTETDPGNYTVTWQAWHAGDNRPISGDHTAEGVVRLVDRISYTNTLDATPPTGIRERNTAAFTGLAAAFLLLFIMRIGKGRKQND